MGFWNKLGDACTKVNDLMEKASPMMEEYCKEAEIKKEKRQKEYETRRITELKSQLAGTTNEQIVKISSNPKLSEVQKRLVEEEMKERGLM